MSVPIAYKQATLKILENNATYVAWIPAKLAIVGKILNLKAENKELEVLFAGGQEKLMTPEDIARQEKSFEHWRSVTDI